MIFVGRTTPYDTRVQLHDALWVAFASARPDMSSMTMQVGARLDRPRRHGVLVAQSDPAASPAINIGQWGCQQDLPEHIA